MKVEKSTEKNVNKLLNWILNTANENTRNKIISLLLAVTMTAGLGVGVKKAVDSMSTDTSIIETLDETKQLKYIVKKDDSAIAIANKFGMEHTQFAQLNGYTNINEMAHIDLGQILNIELDANKEAIPYGVIEVSKGDTLESIASKYSYDPEEIATINNLTDTKKLPKELYLPENYKKTETTDQIVESKDQENTLGYSNISTFFNHKVGEENFVILDVGNHKYTGVRFQDKKIKYCNKHDISVGIIISSEATTENEIYNDVDYAKSVVDQFNIDFPVYLNINNIIENNNLNNEQKKKLIKDFLEKSAANNLYVGIYGTDTNLCRAKDYFGLTEYDALLVMDSDEVKYDGTYNVYETKNGEVHSKVDLASIIKAKNLNDSGNFSNDATYVIKDNENLSDIAMQFGMSVNDLLEFNNLTIDEVKVGDKLIIPSVIDKTIPIIDIENLQFERLEDPIRGCDLSHYQGSNIDWNKISNNFDYVILKCAEGKNTDSCFEKNAMNCNLNNIPMGVFCYNGVTTFSCENLEEFRQLQEEQAEFTIELLKNKKIDYPVYVDVEGNRKYNIRELLTPKQVKIMLEVWQEKISQAGYIPGLYCNQDGYKYIKECVGSDYEITDKLHLWLAGGPQYTGENYDIDLSKVKNPESIFNKYPNATMAQATDSAINCGAGNSRGHLDINFSMIDYTNKQESKESLDEYEYTGYETKEFDRTSKLTAKADAIAGKALQTVGILGGTTLIAGTGFFAGAKYNQYQQKKEKTKVKKRKNNY